MGQNKSLELLLKKSRQWYQHKTETENQSIKKTMSKKDKKKDVALVVPEDRSVENLMKQAIEKGTPVETMEKLLTMRRELKAEWAKEQFDKAMASFQSECPTIKKTKEVKTKAGILAYRFAPIESIVSQVKVPLKDNGFSYTSKQEITERGVKISVKVTHSAGHSEITEMEVPLGNKTDIMSQSQVVAAASTFAKRYAFCNAFGILTGDEDTNGADIPPDDRKEKQDKVKQIIGTYSEKKCKEFLETIKSDKYTEAQRNQLTKLINERLEILSKKK